MSRESKFRIWDGEKFGYVQLGGNRISWPHPDYIGSWTPAACDAVLYFKGVTEFQQYTGQKDKNGKEIYEGDILQYWMDAEFKYPKTVEWRDGGLGIVGRQYSFTHFRFIELNAYTVVGNIYENPELLEV